MREPTTASTVMTTHPAHVEADPAREAGRRLWAALEAGREAADAGAATLEVCRVVEASIERAGGEALLPQERNGRGEAFGFGASVNVNEEAACARPGARRLRAGDLVTIDAAARYAALDGAVVDASLALIVPGASLPDYEALVAASLAAVEAAAGLLRTGARWSEAARAVTRLAGERGCGVAAGLLGHGVGTTLHEGPALAMFADESPAGEVILREGMLLCVEPVLTQPVAGRGRAGTAQSGYASASPRRTPTRTLPDGWGVVTADRSAACCQERTIRVGRAGGQILTAA